MRITFCGSGTFALPTLLALRESGASLQVITQPARPAGRGGKLRHTTVESVGQDHGLEVLCSGDINDDDTLNAIRSWKPDVTVVVEFGQFLRAAARAAARLDTINLHASLLPQLRGAAPINWAIMRGHQCSGVSTFSLVDRMDAGPVYLTREVEIQPQERAGELKERLAAIGAELVLETLVGLDGEALTARPQDETQASFAPRLKKSDGFLDFHIAAEHLCWIIRGTWPWPGARAVFGHREGRALAVTIAQARLADGEAHGPPGSVDDDLCVAAGTGRLEIQEIQPAGKRLMSWKDFVNGYRVAAGDTFNLPEVP